MTWLLRILQKLQFYHLKTFCKAKNSFCFKIGVYCAPLYKNPDDGSSFNLAPWAMNFKQASKIPWLESTIQRLFQQGRYQRQTDRPKHGKSFVILLAR